MREPHFAADASAVSQVADCDHYVDLTNPHLHQLVEQRFGFFEIGCVEAFGEPTVDRREDVTGFDLAALVAAEPDEAYGSAQFPKLGLLSLGNTESLLERHLGCCGISVLQKVTALPK